MPDLLTVGQLIDELMQPGHFFVAPSLQLHWIAGKAEDVPWEIFRGRLVDPAHTRRQARFLSWHVTEESGNPLISVRLDVHAGVVHVTRGILCYVWEGYDAGGNVIESREVQRWTTELVGSAELAQFRDLDELRDELVCLIWQAVVGTSRLPLHSVETPLPAFSFGELHYVYQPWTPDSAAPTKSVWDVAEVIARPEVSHRERARGVEFLFRVLTPATLTPSASLVVARRLTTPEHGDAITRVLRTVFNEISLSPYTDFVPNALTFVRYLAEAAELNLDDYARFLAHLLHQLCRHLTAYDLVTFHQRGANYPDALLLDATLAEYLELTRTFPDWFQSLDAAGRFRRRALRQAWLLHRRYRGHPVPDTPTAPGENARVLPESHGRVRGEQILQPHRRSRRLFTGDALTTLPSGGPAAQILADSLLDLTQICELIQLGIGLFIDRPLGHAKEPGEPDYTPLLAHEAFSKSIARQRLKELATLAQELSLDLPADFFASIERDLEAMPGRGVPAAQLAEPARPTAALTDVRRVAEDFVIVRTMPKGLAEMLAYFELPPVPTPHVVANIQAPRGPVLAFFDAEYRIVLEAAVDPSGGFVRRAGVELPVAGLRIVSIDSREVSDLRAPRREPGGDSGGLPPV